MPIIGTKVTNINLGVGILIKDLNVVFYPDVLSGKIKVITTPNFSELTMVSKPNTYFVATKSLELIKKTMGDDDAEKQRAQIELDGWTKAYSDILYSNILQ